MKNSRKPAMKSSPEARKLIRAVMQGCGRRRSLREVASLLRLPNHGQVQMILNGQMRDTPAMKAALRRADKRAARAWRNAKASPRDAIDAVALRVVVNDLERTLEFLKSLLPKFS